MALLRVLTYNIFMGRGDPAALARIVREADPDVLVVNEGPKAPLLWQRRYRELAGRCRMSYAGGGRPAGANGVLVGSRIQVRATAAERIETMPFTPRRGVVTAQLGTEGQHFGVVGCHLGLDPDRRLGEAEAVLTAAARLTGPVVLCGDLNEPPAGPCWRRFREAGFIDHGSDSWPTFPARRPVKRIDAVLVRGVTEVRRHGDPGVAEKLHARASDHRAVLAVLEL